MKVCLAVPGRKPLKIPHAIALARRMPLDPLQRGTASLMRVVPNA